MHNRKLAAKERQHKPRSRLGPIDVPVTYRPWLNKRWRRRAVRYQREWISKYGGGR
jgi:hypothetical protein